MNTSNTRNDNRHTTGRMAGDAGRIGVTGALWGLVAVMLVYGAITGKYGEFADGWNEARAARAAETAAGDGDGR